jgi:hypothetical protein
MGKTDDSVTVKVTLSATAPAGSATMSGARGSSGSPGLADDGTPRSWTFWPVTVPVTVGCACGDHVNVIPFEERTRTMELSSKPSIIPPLQR